MMSTQSEIELHGHRVCFRHAGEGPLVVLIHGITGRSDQWEPAIEHLATDHAVLAPDLLGHGESAKPRGDYSLGAYASAVRDTMVALGYERATVVGHSLGGGIAMQFAYQFPERCERLVLVSSGGLGREVHLVLRAAALPGAMSAACCDGHGWRPAVTSTCWQRASHRSTTPARDRRSSTPCARSSSRAGSGSAPTIASS